MFQAIKEKIINENRDETPLNLAEFSEVALRAVYQIGEAHEIVNRVFIEQDDDHENLVRLTVEVLASAVYKFDKTTKRDFRRYNTLLNTPTLSKQGYDEFLLLYPTIYAWAAELLNMVYDLHGVDDYYKCHATLDKCIWMDDDRYQCHLCREIHYEVDTIANHNHCDKCRCASAITFQKIFRGLDVRWKDSRSVWLLGQKS